MFIMWWYPFILALSGSTFLQNTLGSGYPRLLRLFHEFFAKIGVHTDTVYISTFQRYLFCTCVLSLTDNICLWV